MEPAGEKGNFDEDGGEGKRVVAQKQENGKKLRKLDQGIGNTSYDIWT